MATPHQPPSPGAAWAAAWAAAWPPDGIDVGGARLGRRMATAADEPLLLRWFVEARPHLAAVPLPEDARDRLVRQQFAARGQHHRTELPDAVDWVLEVDGDPIGHVVLDVDPQRALVAELEVTADRRGAGVGTAVLAVVTSTARQQGIPTRLVVAVDSPARRLYGRLGFVATGDPAATTATDVLLEHP